MINSQKTRRNFGLWAALTFVVIIIVALLIWIGLARLNSHARSYGFALGYTLPSMSQQDRIKELSNIKSLGFSTVRFNLDWSSIQSKNGDTYTWKTSDEIMQDVNNSGLKAIITLDRTPPWARPANCKYSIFCAPANPNDYAKFAGTAVARYKQDPVIAWEIWNEPNIVNFWKPAPNAYQYAQLLRAADIAIKGQDPSAVVLVGGLSGNAINEGKVFIDGRTFLASLYADGTKNYFDGVAFHPYTNFRLPHAKDEYNGWTKLYATNPSIRSIMIANGDQKKGVWITEFGVPTDGVGKEVTDGYEPVPEGADHVSLLLQTNITNQAIGDLQKFTWIKAFMWYTYQDNGKTEDSSYGLLTVGGKPKPAYYALQKVLK